MGAVSLMGHILPVKARDIKKYTAYWVDEIRQDV